MHDINPHACHNALRVHDVTPSVFHGVAPPCVCCVGPSPAAVPPAAAEGAALPMGLGAAAAPDDATGVARPPACTHRDPERV